MLKKIIRKNKYINKLENIHLTAEFTKTVRAVKEKNANYLWDTYYIPKAINEILNEDGYLPTPLGAAPRAKAMFLTDISTGKIDEFFRMK